MGGRARRRNPKERPGRGRLIVLSASTMFAGVVANFGGPPTISQVVFGALAVAGAAALGAVQEPLKKNLGCERMRSQQVRRLNPLNGLPTLFKKTLLFP